MEVQEKFEIFNLDNNTQLEFLQPKTVIVIDKSRFLVCKQLMIQNAQDEAFASFLSIPINKVRYFKYKMALWENQLRAKKRAVKKYLSKCKTSKREISAHDRFKKARELVARNYSTSEISTILKMSERSVTRFKKRMREEKRKLKAEGKLHLDPNDEDTSFKYLTEIEKFRRAKELFENGLRLNEISHICKVSERTVRRWKDRLMKMDVSSLDNNKHEEQSSELENEVSTSNVIEDAFFSPEDDDVKPRQHRQRKPYYDREKIEYATELMQNGLSNKEMSMLLELSIANVRKLKVNILNGTVEELIDDSAEHYSRLLDDASERDDPLNGIDASSIPVIYGSRRKPKVNLTDREMHIVRLLKERGVRTMEIAKMVEISERSVTRLLNKSKEFQIHQYGLDILDEVERLLSKGNQIESVEKIDTEETRKAEIYSNEETNFSQNFISKSRIGMDLIRMKVKFSEIAKMLEVNEKQVYQWKKQVDNELEDTASYIIEEVDPKEEYIEEYLDAT